jgi:hypothetical protein
MTKFAFLILCVQIIGCTSQLAQLEQQWLGKDRNRLIAAKGTPDQVMDDGLGGQIYTYVKIESFTLPRSATMQPTRGAWTSEHDWRYSGAQTITNRMKTMFWINSAGEIYKVFIAR